MPKKTPYTKAKKHMLNLQANARALHSAVVGNTVDSLLDDEMEAIEAQALLVLRHAKKLKRNRHQHLENVVDQMAQRFADSIQEDTDNA